MFVEVVGIVCLCCVGVFDGEGFIVWFWKEWRWRLLLMMKMLENVIVVLVSMGLSSLSVVSGIVVMLYVKV